MNGMIYGFLALWIASVQMVHAAPAARPSDRAYEAAQAAFKSKDYTRARTLAQEFSLMYAADSRVPSALLLKGMAELKNNQSAEARHTWQALAAAHPKADATALALEQLMALTEQKHPSAEQTGLKQKLLAEFPHHAVTVRLCARDAEAKAAQGAFAEAVAEYRKVKARLSDAQKKRLQELVVLQEQHQTTGGGLDRVKEQLSRAKQLVTLGSYVEAGKIFDKVATQAVLLPEGAEAQYWMGVCLAAQTNYTAAVARWASLQDEKMGSQWREQALMEMARTQAFKLNEHDTAIATYRRFLEAFPKSDRRMEAEYQLAGVLYLKKDYPAARAVFEKFIQSYPDSSYGVEAKKYRDKCGAVMAAAAKPVTVAHKTEPAKVAKTPPVKSAAAQLAAEADAALKKNSYQTAYGLYEKIILGYPSGPEYEPAMYRAGQCLVQVGEPRRAWQHWENFLKLRPQSAFADKTLFALGTLYLEELEEPAQAQKSYERLMVDFPKSELYREARFRSGFALFRQGEWERAKDRFVEEAKLRDAPKPGAPPTDLDRLIAACVTKRAPLPFSPLTKRFFGNTANLSKLEGQIVTADMFFTAMNYAKAVQFYERVARAAPGTEQAAYSLLQAGRSYLQLFQPQKAIQCYRPFLKEYANSSWASDALIRAAVIHISQLSDKQAGIELLEKIVTRYPNSSQADRSLAHLATLARWDKNWTKAESLYRELLQRYPKSEFAPYVKTVALPELEKLKHPQPTAPKPA